MSTLAAIYDHVLGFGGQVIAAGEPGSTTITTDSSGTFATAIRNFIAPILLLIISLVAISFIFKRQLTQFFQFAALAVVVAVLFYVPGVVENIAKFFAGLVGGTA